MRKGLITRCLESVGKAFVDDYTHMFEEAHEAKKKKARTITCFVPYIIVALDKFLTKKDYSMVIDSRVGGYFSTIYRKGNIELIIGYKPR